MTLEVAIKTAIDYETRIRDLYSSASKDASDEYGRRLFKTLSDDEQRHIDYLNHKLHQWQSAGSVTADLLESAVPPRQVLEQEIGKLRSTLSEEDRGLKQQMLSKALKLEIETSNFYREMVDELSDEGRQMFARFLEIENGHIDVVQFELDFFSKSGYWMGFKEFDME